MVTETRPIPGPGEVWDEKAAPGGSNPEALKNSVVDTPDYVSLQSGDSNSYVLWVAQMADGIVDWGLAPKARDRQLRDFFPKENYLMSGLASVAARNAAFSWTIEGPPRTVAAAQKMLLQSNRGKGWESLITQVSMDLYSQDQGAFVELIRDGGEGATEQSPVINVAHLDSARMFPTGNADEPFWYLDRVGRFHPLQWFQVVNLLEMPSAIEVAHSGIFFNLQYSAVTRLLRAAQILRNVAIYNEEKTGGRFERAIHLVKGVTAKQISDAVAMHRSNADQAGLRRFIQTPIVGSVDPKADVGASTLELASLPTGWDEDKVMKWYLTALAMAFLTDYQEFAPLPGGNLGTSSQSQILHLKSRGKGPALFQKLITHLMNFQGVLPSNITFRWDEQDIEADKAQADLSLVRAQERAARIQSGEIDTQAARQIALDEGDLAIEVFDAINERADETTDIVANDDEQVKQPPPDLTPPDTQVVDDVQQQAPQPGAGAAPAVKALAEAILARLGFKDDDFVSENGNTVSAYLQTRIHRAFTTSADDMAAIGLMDTYGRIALSGIIGDVLGQFSDQFNATIPVVAQTILDDDDIKHLIKMAEKAYGQKKGGPALKKARLSLEREVQDPIEELLGNVYTKVQAQIRKGKRVA